jgi:membrane fusion protein, multidrug efflux system
MKNLTLFSITLLLAFACSKPVDKKTELANLRKQKAELDTKIAALEKETKPANEDSSRIKVVSITTLQPQTFRHFLEVQGNTDSDNNIMVSPKMGGVITQVFAKVGDNVRAGQVLVVVDDAVLQQNVAQLRTGYELAKTVYERQAALWQQKIGSEIQYLQAKNNKEGLERQIATLQTQLNMSRVTSPINGTVDAVMARVGEAAAPGMPAVRVVNLTQMKVKAKVADTYINSIRKGDAVTVKFPDIKEEIQARITFAGQVVSPQTRTFDIEVSINNREGKVKPNLLSIISINDKNQPNALVIDENLVQRTELGTIVFVAAEESGKTIARLKKITTGLSYGGMIEVTQGLQAGDKIVTAGNQDLVDGQTIRIQEAVAQK